MNNDIIIIIVLSFFFITLNAVLPLVGDEFNQAVNTNDASSLSDDIDTGGFWSASYDFVTYFLQVLAFPFWTFGAPAWLNLTLFLALRIGLITLIIRNIPGIGSGGG